MGIIYKIQSPSGKCYIGKTSSSIKRRKTQHLSSANNPKSPHYNSKICRAIRKYQDELEWIILHNNIENDKLSELEKQEILNHDSFNNGYNSTIGGDGGGFIGRCHSQETKDKLSKLKTGDKNPMYGMTKEKNPFFLVKNILKKLKNMEKGRHVWKQKSNVWENWKYEK